MADDVSRREDFVPISGRALALPPGPIFHLQRAGEADYELGAFRAWAGYKELGAAEATGGLALFQHVLSFGPTEVSGRTGVHCHLAHVHIVIPTSGRGVFSYDGVITEAVPGAVIVQHGGTVHDQFAYSYAAAPAEANKATPTSLDPEPAGAPVASFGFLELFVPRTIANVEIVPPAKVTAADQATAWDHPYHAPGARYALRSAGDPDAAYRPLAGQPGLAVRDCGTWGPSGELVATWIVRPAASETGDPVELRLPGEAGGLGLVFVAAGAVTLPRPDAEPLRLAAGDCLTCTAGLVGAPRDPSPDLRLLVFHISGRAQALRERSPAEIARLEALGPAIITRREVRGEGDQRPVNALHDGPP